MKWGKILQCPEPLLVEITPPACTGHIQGPAQLSPVSWGVLQGHILLGGGDGEWGGQSEGGQGKNERRGKSQEGSQGVQRGRGQELLYPAGVPLPGGKLCKEIVSTHRVDTDVGSCIQPRWMDKPGVVNPLNGSRPAT